MAFVSPFHLLVVLIVIFGYALCLIPIYRIIRRTGNSGWLCLLALVPFVNVIFLWVFAFVPWPTVDRGA